jgi:hypothetical protein
MTYQEVTQPNTTLAQETAASWRNKRVRIATWPGLDLNLMDREGSKVGLIFLQKIGFLVGPE